jgi:hypothetical protein
MAKVQYSPFISNLPGSVANATFSGSGLASVMRHKPYNPRPNNAGQQLFLNLHNEAYQSWLSADEHTRLLFEMLITIYPQYQSNVNSLVKSAMLHYIRSYMYTILTGNDWPDSLEFTPRIVPANIVSVSRSGSSLIATWSRPLGTYEFPFISFSRPQRNHMPSKSNRVCLLIPHLPVSSTHAEYYSAYVSHFGVAPNMGDKLWLKMFSNDYLGSHISDTTTAFITVT